MACLLYGRNQSMLASLKFSLIPITSLRFFIRVCSLAGLLSILFPISASSQALNIEKEISHELNDNVYIENIAAISRKSVAGVGKIRSSWERGSWNDALFAAYFDMDGRKWHYISKYDGRTEAKSVIAIGDNEFVALGVAGFSCSPIRCDGPWVLPLSNGNPIWSANHGHGGSIFSDADGPTSAGVLRADGSLMVFGSDWESGSVWVRILSKEGKVVSTNNIASIGEVSILDAEQVLGGDVITTGYIRTIDPEIGYNRGGPDFNYFAIRFDMHGELKWMNTYGNKRKDEFLSVSANTEHYIVLGGRATATRTRGEDAWIIWIDKKGNEIRRLGLDHNQAGNSVIDLKEDGSGVLVLARTWVEGGKGIWFLRLDSEGGIDWEANFKIDYEHGAILDSTTVAISRTEGRLITFSFLKLQ